MAKSRIVPVLSAGRARVRQAVHGAVGAHLGPGSGADVDATTRPTSARPVNFPQRARGELHLTWADLPPVGSAALRRLVYGARRRARVRVSGAPSEAGRDALLVLGAAGAPLEYTGAPSLVDEYVGADLGRAMRASFDSGHRGRELRSVRVRRAALDRLDERGAVPDVSVLLASRRPADLGWAIDQVRAQVGCRVQLLIGLHGEVWAGDAESRLPDLPAGSEIHRFGSELTLGEVLTALGEHAAVEFVSKWDDDDWYGRDHLADLVRAHRYSGAELVGKAAEFVYVEQADVTLRRFDLGAEAYSPTLAGGTLLTTRTWLDAVGGWPAVPRSVDRAVIDATRRAGGRTYRTHGFQYVLRRSGGAHTWQQDDRHFLDAAREIRSGLDLDFADVEPPSGVA